MSLIALSVTPLIVNVLPLLVCPYAKIVAAGIEEIAERMQTALNLVYIYIHIYIHTYIYIYIYIYIYMQRERERERKSNISII